MLKYSWLIYYCCFKLIIIMCIYIYYEKRVFTRTYMNFSLSRVKGHIIIPNIYTLMTLNYQWWEMMVLFSLFDDQTSLFNLFILLLLIRIL